MWRDRWFVLGVIGAALSCLACLTPVVVLALGALGLGVWSGHLDVVLLAVLAVSAGLVLYRYWAARRRVS
ncbi:MAG: mercury resistance system transport protein MerF [Gammaproteobacteria bacterium]